VTNMSRRTKRVVALYDKRGTSTQWIKKDKDAFRLEYLFASFPTTNTAGANAGGTGGTNPVRGGPGHPGCSRRRELQVLRGREGLTPAGVKSATAGARGSNTPRRVRRLHWHAEVLINNWPSAQQTAHRRKDPRLLCRGSAITLGTARSVQAHLGRQDQYRKLRWMRNTAARALISDAL
jgi:hypothetical protein